MQYDKKYTLDDLFEIVAKLCGPGGCPWDREQTHESIKQCVIEEAYEVVDAINKNDFDMLCDELGDLLFQVVFHSHMASKQGKFDIDQVLTGICKKMIRRHAHVFGEATADTADDVVNLWEDIKKEEKDFSTYIDMLNDVPNNLPALIRAYKVKKRARKSGLLDNESIKSCINSLYVQAETLKCKNSAAAGGVSSKDNKGDSEAAKDYKNTDNTENDGDVSRAIGQMLFDLVGISAVLKISPEQALTDTTERFISCCGSEDSL